jgi:hypothetical protein
MNGYEGNLNFYRLLAVCLLFLLPQKIKNKKFSKTRGNFLTSKHAREEATGCGLS